MLYLGQNSGRSAVVTLPRWVYTRPPFIMLGYMISTCNADERGVADMSVRRCVCAVINYSCFLKSRNRTTIPGSVRVWMKSSTIVPSVNPGTSGSPSCPWWTGDATPPASHFVNCQPCERNLSVCVDFFSVLMESRTTAPPRTTAENIVLWTSNTFVLWRWHAAGSAGRSVHFIFFKKDYILYFSFYLSERLIFATLWWVCQ